MHWCEKKASESDQLAKLFNVKDKKLSVSNDVSGLNDMSIINNSKHKLDPDEDQLWLSNNLILLNLFIVKIFLSLNFLNEQEKQL